ncbi:hypothetical protein BVER_01197c [Candidatus Burkholderia verschuerenii]|uniref:Gfo/Idh/MocA-like oxidoreductase N-terminal domain-containing protein n=1 Tax=Candidatus Burkholderia verschuerenii TaxID=242163 RepID=A0A0L0M938_9BURK|nr:Gfo/Idh/MocA family oxidoreductase [Candidatus Burkholderia verschuerenii]KND59167.1 hypothetical protein BVER_01197c [Candidatus Burkholderia verschuerenii]
MKLLIIGLGYAGKRYQRSFAYLSRELNFPLEVAYVGRKAQEVSIPYYDHISTALKEFQPEVVIVSVNDQSHVSILNALKSFSGFVICEKPVAVFGDDWKPVLNDLRSLKGFAFDLVERYSDVTRRLRTIASYNEWTLVRASFHWGKDRLNDYRPTCGVTSEVIHALDLLSWIRPSKGPLLLRSAIGICSDFSISGHAVLDTALLTGRVGDAPFSGYSSFVNIERQRTVDFTFVDPSGKLFHARCIYDTPAWDHDHLRVWTRDQKDRDLIIEEYRSNPSTVGLETLHKLSRLCEDVVKVANFHLDPSQPFADIEDAARLQRLLDEITVGITDPLTATYQRGEQRILIAEDADLETLG